MTFPKPAKRGPKAPKRIKRTRLVQRSARITKKSLATLRKKLIKKADAICGTVVRARGACEACGSTEILQWAHGYGRRHLRTRWSTWFTFCLCRRCHCKFTKHWELWVAWMLDKLGHDMFLKMQADALRADPITNDEIQEIIEKLERMNA